MKQRLSICTNYGNCTTADSKKKIPITGSENYCPTCGSQLTEYQGSHSRWPVIFGMAFIFLLVFGFFLLLWQWLTPIEKIGKTAESTNSPQFITASNTNTLELVKDSACLLDQAPMDNQSAKIHQMLPMTEVAALKDYPIPRDIHPWIKTLDKITAPGFSIMRREVTVGEFKNYVTTLPEPEKMQLGYDWQQDRNGVPLPDNYPVGSVPWEYARDYATWLSKQSGCALVLPTYQQWVAAVVQHANVEQAVTRQHQQAHFLRPTQRPQTPETVVDLLGNLREWSQEGGQNVCPQNQGHYLLGEDFKTWLQYINGEPYCETMALDTVGFRLVRIQ